LPVPSGQAALELALLGRRKMIDRFQQLLHA
jgi:hypothetical protein